MMIKNLSLSHELDAAAMHTLRGGLQDTLQGNGSGSATAIGVNGGIGNTTLALVAPSQTNVNAPSFVNEPVAVAIAGSAAFAF